MYLQVTKCNGINIIILDNNISDQNYMLHASYNYQSKWKVITL